MYVPKVTENSFQLEPDCTDGFILYSSIIELLSTTYSLSITVESVYNPLLYQI